MEKEFDLALMEAPASNVFGIAQPESCSCQIWHYGVGHSVLSIYVRYSATAGISHKGFYLVFDSVRYFEGPFTWPGANFCTTPLDEYLRLLHLLQLSEKVDPGSLPETYALSPPVQGRLFTVDAINLQVKIIASHVSMVDKLPEV
ncbi:MAG: hypothetical protein K8L99_23495 [Anaerolineae bacterium]|nr:hypothetical protein [Anaerolineae bacterium]